MSKYTTEVRYICEQAAGFGQSGGFDDVENIIQLAIPNVFNFSFPIFDESYRNVLQTKILRHFYTREIGLETVGLWKLKLSTKLNEIMPYYNKLYNSELLEFNPLYDVDLTRTSTIDRDGTRDVKTTDEKTANNTTKNTQTTNNNYTVNGTDNETNNLNVTNDNKRMYSDTPQGAISDLEAGRYLTNATIDNGSNSSVQTTGISNQQLGQSAVDVSGNGTNDTVMNGSGTSNTTIKDTEDYLETVKGKQGTESYSSMLLKYRDTFINIDMMVINDLEELFMQLW